MATEENLFEETGPTYLAPEIKGLKKTLENKLFSWNTFNFNSYMRGFFLNLVDPMMRPDGYLISLVRIEDLSPHKNAGDFSMITNSTDNLEIKLSSSESQKVKRIQEFVCARYKISSSAFLNEIKKKTRTKSLIREATAHNESLVGQYVESHETKNPMKSIKLYNMNTLKLNTTMPNISAVKSESLNLFRGDRNSVLGATISLNPNAEGLDSMILQRINTIAGHDSSSHDSSSLLGRVPSDLDGTFEIDVGKSYLRTRSFRFLIKNH